MNERLPDWDEFREQLEASRRRQPHELLDLARQTLEAWERDPKGRTYNKVVRDALGLLRKDLKLRASPVKTPEEARRVFDETRQVVQERCEPLRAGEVLFPRLKGLEGGSVAPAER